jgi:hypothetical protein
MDRNHISTIDASIDDSTTNKMQLHEAQRSHPHPPPHHHHPEQHRDGNNTTTTTNRDIVEHFITLLGSAARHTTTLEENETALIECFSHPEQQQKEPSLLLSSSSNPCETKNESTVNEIDIDNDNNENDYDDYGSMAADDDLDEDVNNENDVVVCFLPDFQMNVNDQESLQLIEDKVRRMMIENNNNNGTSVITRNDHDDNSNSNSNSALMNSNSSSSTCRKWTLSYFLLSVSAIILDMVVTILIEIVSILVAPPPLPTATTTTTTTSSTTTSETSEIMTVLSFTRMTVSRAPLIVIKNMQETFSKYSRLRFLQWKERLLLLNNQGQQHDDNDDDDYHHYHGGGSSNHSSDGARLAQILNYSKMIVSCRSNTSFQLLHDVYSDDDHDENDDADDDDNLQQPEFLADLLDHQRMEYTVVGIPVERYGATMNDHDHIPDDMTSENKKQTYDLNADDTSTSTSILGDSQNSASTTTTNHDENSPLTTSTTSSMMKRAKCRIEFELFVKIRKGIRTFATTNFTIPVSTIGELHCTCSPNYVSGAPLLIAIVMIDNPFFAYECGFPSLLEILPFSTFFTL